MYIKILDVEYPKELNGIIHGMVRQLKNGDYCIYLNQSDSKSRRKQTLQHELMHILLGDFRSGGNVQEIEARRHIG